MQKYCFLTGTFCLGGVMPIEFQNGDEKSVNLPSQRGEKRINSLSYIEHFQRSWEGRETILFPYFDIHLVLFGVWDFCFVAMAVSQPGWHGCHLPPSRLRNRTIPSIPFQGCRPGWRGRYWSMLRLLQW